MDDHIEFLQIVHISIPVTSQSQFLTEKDKLQALPSCVCGILNLSLADLFSS